MSGHTPTPWEVRNSDTDYNVRGADGLRVVSTSWHDSMRHPYPLKDEAAANIAFIVKAVNAIGPKLDQLEALCRKRGLPEVDGLAMLIAEWVNEAMAGDVK